MPRGMYKRKNDKRPKLIKFSEVYRDADKTMHAQLQREWDRISMAEETIAGALIKITEIMAQHAKVKRI
jgi:hypothetical protein